MQKFQQIACCAVTCRLVETRSADTSVSFVHRDIECFYCNYDLRGILRHGVCPECGQQVQTSLIADAMGVTAGECSALRQVGLLLMLAMILSTAGGALLLFGSEFAGRVVRGFEATIVATLLIRLILQRTPRRRDYAAALFGLGVLLCAILPLLPILNFTDVSAILWSTSGAMSLLATILIASRIADAAGRLRAYRAETTLLIGGGLHILASILGGLVLLGAFAVGGQRILELLPLPGTAFVYAALPSLLFLLSDFRAIMFVLPSALSGILYFAGVLLCTNALSNAEHYIKQDAAETMRASFSPGYSRHPRC